MLCVTCGGVYFANATAYVSLDCHRNNDLRPYVYVTRDFGRTWESIGTDLPAFGCVNVVKQDPRNESILYAGTEFGFFVSLDEGKSWKPCMTGLPTVRVDDVVVHPRDGDLVVGTHGRSVLVMDDVTPLQQLTDEVLAREEHLFEPREAVLWRADARLARGVTGVKRFFGKNPEQGTAIHYYLRQPARGSVEIAITDLETGEEFRRTECSGEARHEPRAVGSPRKYATPRARTTWAAAGAAGDRRSVPRNAHRERT